MSFFSKLKSRKLSKTLAAVAASGILFFGASDALAAPNNANAEFRQAYLSLANDVRTFDQTIIFFGTTFHVDMNGQGQILRDDSMRMSGNINWEYTDPETDQTTNTNIPYYMTHSNNEMILYVQRNNRWSRFLLPIIPADFIDAIKSNSMSVLEDNLNAVKRVEIFRETDTQEIFNITLDGEYLAERLNEYSQKNNTGRLSSNEIAERAKNFRNLEKALRKTDLICTWTVDKNQNATLTAVVDLTPLMRAYAESVLAEAAAGTIVLGDEERLFMETIGYYSELHYSMSSSRIENTKTLVAPIEAVRAPVNQNVFQDLIRRMITSVR